MTEDGEVALLALRLAARHRLTARRVHDARHAASALVAGVTGTLTYDVHDWRVFEPDGLSVIGPASLLRQTRTRP